MSFKGSIEDKSVEAPLPRSLTNLLKVTDELKQAVARKRPDAVKDLMEEAERVWKVAQTENITIYSHRGDQDNCARYASALNSCNQVMASGVALLMHQR